MASGPAALSALILISNRWEAHAMIAACVELEIEPQIKEH
jgi:hypothetical protein